MRFIIGIIIGVFIICGEVYLGVKTFFPELSTTKVNYISELIENKEPIINKLSEEELSYIRTNPRVIVGTDPNFYPLETFDERGQYTGLGSDYLKLINHLTGLELRAVREKDWASAELLAEQGEIDAFLAIAQTERRLNYLKFTDPYIFLHGMIVTRRNEAAENITITDLKAKKVAVVENYFWHDYLVSNFPELELVLVPTTSDALHLLSNHEVYATIDYEFNLTEKIQAGGFLQLQTAGNVNSVQGHAIAVRKDLPILFNIINQAVESISQADHELLAQKWLVSETASENKQTQWYFFFFTQAVLLCIMLTIYMNSKITQALREKREEQKLEQIA